MPQFYVYYTVIIAHNQFARNIYTSLFKTSKEGKKLHISLV